MTKKTRLIILLICVACFFIVAPILVAYSMGYRFDFEKMKVTATGGIYVKTYPAADQIFIDSKISEKPGMFSNSIFVQSLLPNDHTILVKKTGYNDYFKTLPVQEKQVTKIENVLLIKKNIQFDVVIDQSQSPFDSTEKFIIKNGNLYYSDAAENSGLSNIQKLTPLIKKVITFSLQSNNIVWLGADGFLYKSDIANLSTPATKINLTAIKMAKAGFYKIINNNRDIFIDNNGSLLILNDKTNNLDVFYASVKDAKISPDGKNIIYYNDNNIYISPIGGSPIIKNTLYKSSEKINDCVWLNNNYIIFVAGNKIIISETDYRGNVNATTLPQSITLSPDQKIDIKSPQIFFSQSAGKLYILVKDTLLASEKITP